MRKKLILFLVQEIISDIFMNIREDKFTKINEYDIVTVLLTYYGKLLKKVLRFLNARVLSVYYLFN